MPPKRKTQYVSVFLPVQIVGAAMPILPILLSENFAARINHRKLCSAENMFPLTLPEHPSDSQTANSTNHIGFGMTFLAELDVLIFLSCSQGMTLCNFQGEPHSFTWKHQEL